VGQFLKENLKNEKNYFSNLSQAELKLFQNYSSSKLTRDTFDLPYAQNLKQFDADNFHYLLTMMKITSLSQ
jgi:hypothetical protein